MANFHIISGSGDSVAHPIVRKIGLSDLTGALRDGFRDFWRKPSHLVFLGLIYVVVGIALAFWTTGANALPMLYPLMTGFALVGSFAALPLYEVSRRYELGQQSTWREALAVFRTPALPAIAAIGALLFALFYLWLAAAETLYQSLFSLSAPTDFSSFLTAVFNTERGRMLLLWGNLAGLGFAFVTLATTVIALPLLVDRDVGAMVAIDTSVRAVIANPIPMLAWGLIVAVLLGLGSLPLFVGLAIVVPVLGHATWHLYRRVIAPVTPQ